MSDLSPDELEALINGYVGSEDESESQDDTPETHDNGTEPSAEVSTEESASIDDMLAGIDGIIDDAPAQAEPEPQESDSSEVAAADLDDILSGIDGIVDDAPAPKPETQAQDNSNANNIDNQIEEGIYPMPVEKEHKVVNQLSQVAEDSEAKASQIFDVLSFILDENDGIGKNVDPAITFLDEQMVLLEKLSQKFPNVEVFSENLLKAQDAKSNLENITNTINGENDKLFEAMELMQFHDINRQKIERVMAVIRKLSNYLNGLFEDDSTKPEVQIAKHISGDTNDTVTADDIDSMISQYAAEE